MEVVLFIVVGLVAGIASGFLGVGGAVVVVPALVLFMGYSQHMAQGTSLALMLPPIGIFALMSYYKHGHVDIKAAVFIILGFLIGSFFAGRIAMTISPLVLKKTFALCLLIASVKLFIAK